MTKNWINFRFLHICPVEKCEISPNLAKIHISPHLLCGKTEIPLHVEKFHVLKSEISPHGRFLLHLHVGDRGDKYQVWCQFFVTFPHFECGRGYNRFDLKKIHRFLRSYKSWSDLLRFHKGGPLQTS